MKASSACTSSNSKTHGTNRVDEDHQNAINTAETLVKAIKVNGVNVVVETTFKR